MTKHSRRKSARPQKAIEYRNRLSSLSDDENDAGQYIFNRSILLHELVHHLQAASGRFDMGSGAFVRRNAGVWVFRACVERTGHNATRHLKLGVGARAACMPNAGSRR